ncbi:hypothetical protein CALVIDRAFT_268753 [Calocera viscosa TUFC12733]|uniref:Uncharacterized protein n=1 Tax=Calocera viscosa (strain TUFC12733) TaxID=1330018 RepID=A0A167J1D7_CALVF|nr:hypothetical protein CALVIDRAFT_268753 [Calocera viscosa TUFC12733]
MELLLATGLPLCNIFVTVFMDIAAIAMIVARLLRPVDIRVGLLRGQHDRALLHLVHPPRSRANQRGAHHARHAQYLPPLRRLPLLPLAPLPHRLGPLRQRQHHSPTARWSSTASSTSSPTLCSSSSTSPPSEASTCPDLASRVQAYGASLRFRVPGSLMKSRGRTRLARLPSIHPWMYSLMLLCEGARVRCISRYSLLMHTYHTFYLLLWHT